MANTDFFICAQVVEKIYDIARGEKMRNLNPGMQNALYFQFSHFQISTFSKKMLTAKFSSRFHKMLQAK